MTTLTADIALAVTVVLGLGSIAALVLRRCSPALRHAAWRATLAGVWLAPLAVIAAGMLPVQRPEIAVPVPRYEPAPNLESTRPRVDAVQPEAGLVAETTSGRGRPDSGVGGAAPREPVPLAAILLSLWGAGALVAFFTFARDARALGVLLSEGAPSDRPATVEAIAQRLGLARLPRVRRSAEVSVPAVAGWLRPTLVLPSEAGADEAALIHELAHVQRGDVPTLGAARLTAAVWWWHPLAWLMLRGLAATAEEACDDVVLALTGARREYAQMLTDWAERASVAGAVNCGSHGKGLVARVRRVLDERVRPVTTLSRRSRTAVTVVAVLAICIAGAFQVRSGSIAWADVVVPPEIEQLLIENRYEQALAAAKQDLKTQSDSPAALAALARAYEVANRKRPLTDEEAEDFYSVADRLIEEGTDGPHPRFWRALAVEHTEGEQAHEEALRAVVDYCGDLIEADPADPEAWFVRGKALLRLDEREAAAIEFERAVELDPGNPWAHWFYAGGAVPGPGQMNEENYREFARRLEAAIEIAPRFKQALSSLGFAYGQLDRPHEALEIRRRAVEVNPDDARAHWDVGFVLEYHLDRLEEALAEYERGIELDPKDNLSWTAKARLLHYDWGRSEEALELLREATEQVRPEWVWSVWEERGDILADLERWEEARAKYESAIECVEREGYEAQLPTLLIDRARTYLETGDYADAWRDVHRAEDLGEELELTWLGRILDRVREPLREKMPEPERAGDRADDGSADR